jgi:hypothetical protein
VTGRDEAQAWALFQQRYRNTPSLLASQIEQRVIGGDWGANGFTTMAQADTLADELHLSAADRLLDVGTGRGWPGLYVAAQTGCRVVLTDLPWKGCGWPPTAPPAKGSPPARTWWPRRLVGCRFEPAASMWSSTPMCCVDCGPSSPC